MNLLNWLPGMKTYLAGSAVALIGLGELINEFLTTSFAPEASVFQVLAVLLSGAAFTKVMAGLGMIFMRKGISGTRP